MEKEDQLPQYKFLTTELSQIIESWIAHKRYDSLRSEHLGRKAQEYVENYNDSMRQFVETIKKHRDVKGNYKIQEARI
jgi:hypothetical protein